jgi:hypothetical protein
MSFNRIEFDYFIDGRIQNFIHPCKNGNHLQFKRFQESERAATFLYNVI